MGVFNKIKAWFFYRFLHMNIDDNKRTKKIFNIKTATTFGVLYDIDNVANNKWIDSFVKDIQSKGKKVTLLGYTDDKKAESNEAMNLFNKASLNWYQIPRHKEVDAFITQPFDVLIAIHTTESLPLQYIAAHSKAKFRMGPHLEKANSSYDWMIYSEQNLSIEDYLKQVTFYLNNINS
jgi:hypothetical protein